MENNIISGRIEEISKYLPDVKSDSFPRIDYSRYLEFNKEIYSDLNKRGLKKYHKTSLELLIDESLQRHIISYDKALSYEEEIRSKDFDKSTIIFQYASTPYVLNKVNYSVRVLITSIIRDKLKRNPRDIIPVMILENPLPQNPKESKLIIDNQFSVNLKFMPEYSLDIINKGVNDYFSRDLVSAQNKAEVLVHSNFLNSLSKVCEDKDILFRQAALDILVINSPETYFIMYDDLLGIERDKLINPMFDKGFLGRLVDTGLISPGEVPLDIVGINGRVSISKENIKDSTFRYKKALLNPVIANLYNATPIMSIRPNTISIANMGLSIIGINSNIKINKQKYTIPALGYNKRDIIDYLIKNDLSSPILIESRGYNQEEFGPLGESNLGDRLTQIIKKREIFRKKKDFIRADSLRDLLLKEGIEIRDYPNETYFRKITRNGKDI